MIDVSGLSVAFGGVTVLRGVDLSIAAGRCLAVVGGSGSGKSVLARTLIGLADEGRAGVNAARTVSAATVTCRRMSVAGRDMSSATAQQWRELRGGQVGFVPQDAMQSLDPLRILAAEVGEALRVRGVRRRERRARVAAALRQAGLPEAERQMTRRPGELSGGMRQRALIAAAVVGEPSLLIADEPTTALDSTVAAAVLSLIAGLRDAGTAVLLISHDLGAVARVADDIAVLDDGCVVEYGPAAQVLSEPRHPVTKRLYEAIPRGPRRVREPGPAALGDARADGTAPKADAVRAAVAAVPAEPPVIAATGLRKSFHRGLGRADAAVWDVDIAVRRGETMGLVGESGSGKSTLARILIGALQPDAGQVHLLGAPWVPLPERRRRPLRRSIRLVPQDPLGSFDPRLTAEQILRRAIQRAATPGTETGTEGPTRSVDELMDLVHLPASVRRRNPRTLSGGQRQRLAIARALAADPAVLLLDEPVSALDVTTQAAIIDLLATVQQATSMGMIFISHDLAVVRSLCDTVAVMHRGRIVESGPVEQVWGHSAHPVTRELLTASRSLSA